MVKYVLPDVLASTFAASKALPTSHLQRRSVHLLVDYLSEICTYYRASDITGCSASRTKPTSRIITQQAINPSSIYTTELSTLQGNEITAPYPATHFETLPLPPDERPQYTEWLHIPQALSQDNQRASRLALVMATFLALPLEIREMIYSYLLVDVNVTDLNVAAEAEHALHERPGAHWENPLRGNTFPPLHPLEPRYNTALFRVCKRISAESLLHFHIRNNFVAVTGYTCNVHHVARSLIPSTWVPHTRFGRDERRFQDFILEVEIRRAQNWALPFDDFGYGALIFAARHLVKFVRMMNCLASTEGPGPILAFILSYNSERASYDYSRSKPPSIQIARDLCRLSSLRTFNTADQFLYAMRETVDTSVETVLSQVQSPSTFDSVLRDSQAFLYEGQSLSYDGMYVLARRHLRVALAVWRIQERHHQPVNAEELRRLRRFQAGLYAQLSVNSMQLRRPLSAVDHYIRHAARSHPRDPRRRPVVDYYIRIYLLRGQALLSVGSFVMALAFFDDARRIALPDRDAEIEGMVRQTREWMQQRRDNGVEDTYFQMGLLESTSMRDGENLPVPERRRRRHGLRHLVVKARDFVRRHLHMK